MSLSLFVVAALSALVGVSAQVHVTTAVGSKPEVSKRLRGTDGFVPMPPTIECDDMFNSDGSFTDNGILCIYLVSDATTLVTNLTLGDVTMPANNSDFVVAPPATIGVEGGWFSFHSLIETGVQPWSGEVQYTALDSAGDTYVMSVTFTFSETIIDIGFNFPQRHGIDVMPEVYYSPNWVTGFHIYDK